MSLADRFRHWYEHECDCNDKMLAMIESVPVEKRTDARYARAVDLASHLAACRENWLDRMVADGEDQVEWFARGTLAEALRGRFEQLQATWRNYLATLTDTDLELDFDFPVGDGRHYRWSIEGQLVQLVGHAAYHRGQVSLLVDELGGETVDTDYLYWETKQNPNYAFL